MTPRRHLPDIALLCCAFLLVAARFAFVCDDAYITFRYAKNLASGLGLVFNPGEFPPVEGYSDFLWLVAATGLELVHLRPDVVLPAVSAACGLVLVTRIHAVLLDRLDVGRTAAFLAALAFAASPATGCWATSGLETMPQALLTFLLFERLVLVPADRTWPVPAVLSVMLAMIRTEGIGWVLVVYGASVLSRLADREPIRMHLLRLARSAVPMLVVFALYTAWRFQYYGTLVPNTALVKVAFSLRAAERGARYVLLFWATCLAPVAMLVPLPWLLRDRHQGVWLAIGALACAFPVYGVVVGGDFMPFGRLLLPGLPFAALALGGGLQELVRRERGRAERVRWLGLGLAFVGILPAFDLHLVPESVREQLHFRLSDKEYLSELNRWQNQKDNSEGFTRRGLALAQVARPGDAVVAAAVGAVGYFSGITIYDQHGLVTKEIAYRDVPPGPLTQSPGHDKHVDPDYFVKYEPKFLYARELDGKLSAGRMKETLEQWEVPDAVKDRYVPDWYEVTLPDTKRAFLFVIRRRTDNEDPARLWNGFAERRKQLNQELREELGGDDDDAGGEGPAG